MAFNPHRLAAKKHALKLRSAMLRSVREFFYDRDYVEVETPHRIPAPIPEAHISPEVSGNWFLHTSPEICMKQMLAAGYDRIFQICRCFRRAERGARHLPEFTLLEWYAAGADYRFPMQECEALFGYVARHLGKGLVLHHQQATIDLTPPWPCRTVTESFERFSPISLTQAMAEDRFDEMMGLHIEPKLGLDKPEFLIDYPASFGALARLKPGAPEVAERFELYVAGMEICNGFSELNNPAEQRRRFDAEQRTWQQLGRPIYPTPERFLDALSTMPDAAGNALGIDRMVMLFADTPDIERVTTFTPEDL